MSEGELAGEGERGRPCELGIQGPAGHSRASWAGEGDQASWAREGERGELGEQIGELGEQRARGGDQAIKGRERATRRSRASEGSRSSTSDQG